MTTYFRPLIYGILMWAVFFYAVRRGGWAERTAAASIIVASYLTLIVNFSDPRIYEHVEWDVLTIDSLLFLVTMYIVIRSDKFWPIWLSAIQGVTLLCHFAS